MWYDLQPLPNIRPIMHTHLAGIVLGWAFASVGLLSATAASAQTERGLVLSSSALSSSRVSHWGPRLGMVVTDTNTKANHALSSTDSSLGLKVQSAHFLSDYNFGDGFRATVGLVRGATNLPWWETPDNSMRNGKGLTIQRLDVLTAEGLPNNLGMNSYRTVPYLGAGYHGRMGDSSGVSAWRFQADLGIISLDAANATNFGKVLSGNQGVDELIRELRLSPVVKFSINYKF